MQFRGIHVGIALAMVATGFVAVAPTAEAVTYVNVYLLIRWDGEGCVGSGSGTSISLVARDMWQALGTKTTSWPGYISGTRCKGDSYQGLISVGPLSLIKYDNYHTYRLEASITDATGTRTFYSTNQNIRIGSSCIGSTYYMGTSDAYCSSTQPSSNYLGVQNAMPAAPSIASIYPDYPDPTTQIYLYWSGVSPMPSDFDWWEVHMSKTSGFTPSYSYPSTLIAKKTWGYNYHKVTGLVPGQQYCFIIRNADRYWEPDNIVYRKYRSYGESGERCVNTRSATLRVTSPNGGEIWSGTHDDTWVGGTPGFKVEVSKDSGASYSQVASSVTPRAWAWDTKAWPDGTTYRVRVSDSGGNDVSDNDFWVDNTPPVTNASLSGGTTCNGWYSTPPTITLSATDNLAGVRNTYWAADGGAPRAYAGGFLLTGDGNRNFEYWSDDRADRPNVETPRKSWLIPIDTTPPVTTLKFGTPTHHAGTRYVNDSTDLILEALDAGSGVNWTQYRIDGGAWKPYTQPFRLSGPDGYYTIEFRSADKACKQEADKSERVFLDDTHPFAEISKPAPGSVTLGDDELVPGLAPLLALIEQAKAGLPAPPAAVPALPVTPEQACTAARIIADGLRANGQPDLATLVLSLLCPRDPDAPAIVSGTVKVVANATDPIVNGDASGMARVEFYVDGALRATDSEAPFEWYWNTTPDEPGAHALRVIAFDNLGQDTAAERQVVVLSSTTDADVCGAIQALALPPELEFARQLVLFAVQTLGIPCEPQLPAIPGVPDAPSGAPGVPGGLPATPPTLP